MDFFKEFEKIKSSDNLPEEEKFIVDGRKINVPQSLANIGVRNDNHAETVEFEMHRYFDGKDLSEHLLHIDFINAGSEADSYLVETVTSTPEKINFIWNISNKVTKYKGTVKFALRFSTVSEEKVIYAWHSEIAQFNVLDGLSVTSSIGEQYPDLLQQWENRMKELDVKINNVSKEVNSKLLNTNSDFNIFVEEKKKVFNDNFEEKKDLYNQNTVSKLEKYNSNSEEKLKIFNDNADEQKELYNQNHLQKIDEIKALNVYTKEEVDYMLNDKMDKPYVPLTINDNTTIENTLSGNFKIDSIEGNCYQDSLENVSPSPERNIPIISKKIDITVPSENVFDLQTESNTDLIPEEGIYKSIAVHQLKPNTEYKIGFESVNVPAKANLTLRIKNNSGTVICNIYTFFNLNSTPKIETGSENIFLTDSTGNISFEFSCTVKLSNTVETYREYWYTKITNGIYLYENKPNIKTVEIRSLKKSVNLFDIKLYVFNYGMVNTSGVFSNSITHVSTGFIEIKPNTTYVKTEHDEWRGVSKTFYDKDKNFISNSIALPFITPNNAKYFRLCLGKSSITQEEIDLLNNAFMVVEGTTVPSTYVAPTVRDYKIVNHVNKRSYIERNVIQKNLADLTPQKVEHTKFIATYVYSTKPEGKESSWNNIFCNSFATYSYSGFPTDIKEGIHVSNYGIYVVLDDKRNVTTIEEYKEWLKDNPIIVNYQLATSNIEEIVYTENDINELGKSYQDSTSPSLNIPEKIETVTELNIKYTNKNMFNPQNLSGGEIMKFNGVDCYKYIDKSSNFVFDFSHNIQEKAFTFTTRIFREGGISNGTYMHFIYSDGSKKTMQIQNVNQVCNFTSDPNKILKRIEGNNSWAKTCYIDLSVTQLEDGDTATEYQPYKETAILYVLEEPLLKVGDKADTIDIVNLARKNNIYKEDLTTLTINSVDNNGMYNHINTTNRFYNLNVFSNVKASSNYQTVMSSILPYVQNVWIYDKIGITINARNQVHVSLPNILTEINESDSSAKRTEKLNAYIKSMKGTGNEYIYYAVETPTTEPLESKLIEKIKQSKTYGSVTHIFIYGKIKPTINGRYSKDILLAQQKLETKLLNLQTEVIRNV